MKEISLKKWALIGAALLVLGIVMAVIAEQNEWETVTLTSASPAEITGVRVQTDDLEVRIYDGWGDGLEVDASKSVRRRLRVFMDGDVLTVEEKSGWRFLSPFRNEGYVIVWLPADCGGYLSVTTASGEISLNGVSNEGLTAQLSASSGDISAYDLVLGGLTAQSVSGDVYAGSVHIAGDAELLSTSGYVSLYDSACGGAMIQTVSGDMSLSGVTAADTISVYTTSGDLNGNVLKFASLLTSSVSGDVWLELEGVPEDYAVSVATVSGDVEGVTDRAEGERSLTVNTVSGDVRVFFQE